MRMPQEMHKNSNENSEIVSNRQSYSNIQIMINFLRKQEENHHNTTNINTVVKSRRQIINVTLTMGKLSDRQTTKIVV